MSHGLTIHSSGFVEMAFVGETPWHKLGQQLQEGAPIEAWLQAAGMQWKIQRSKVRYHFGHGADEFKTWDDKHVLFRSDTKAPLGLVSPQYKVVQPREVIEFFRDLVENAGYRLHTAGTIHGGRKMWALAKVSEAVINAYDSIGAYLLLSTACDGSMETEGRFTSIRTVCKNTLAVARADGKPSIKVGHRSHFDADKVKREIGLIESSFDTFMDDARTLAEKRITQAEAEEMVRELLRPSPKTPAKIVPIIAAGAPGTATEFDFARLMSGTVKLAEPEADEKRAPRGEAEILALFAGKGKGSELEGSRGTAWGLVNAITEYFDFHRSAKSIDHRLDSALFGTGDEMKTRAFEMAKAL